MSGNLPLGPTGSNPDALSPGDNLTYASDASGIPTGQTAAGANKRVVVSLRINVDTSGNVDLFSAGGEVLENVVICAVKMDVSALYVSDANAVLQFYEPSGIVADISGSVNTTYFSCPTSAHPLYPTTAANTKFVSDMTAVIAGAQDASSAGPFTSYNAVNSAQQFNSFGKLVLALYSHYIFGHALATAAIDNDKALVDYINTNTPALGSPAAEIATHLAQQLVELSNTDASIIAQRVISQDPSRSRGVASEYDEHHGLMFAAGDVIYVAVTVLAPSITVGEGTKGDPQTNTLVNLVQTSYPTPPKFNLQITLA